jgi:hypothetical protein
LNRINILGFSKLKLSIKRAKLVEESMSYETLAAERICSEDEIPMEQSREYNRLRKMQKIMKRAKFIKVQINDLK